MRTARPGTFRRFLDSSQAYINGVVEEARLRERREVADLDGYLLLRRENSAVRLCFGFIEYALGIDLPDEVFADPIFQKIYFASLDMVIWANVRAPTDNSFGLLISYHRLIAGCLFLWYGTRTTPRGQQFCHCPYEDTGYGYPSRKRPYREPLQDARG
jgi:Terpene synthase family 2, C-terminal metal binding